MGTLVKKETTTTQKPDGTIVTTTTRTHTLDRLERSARSADYEYEDDFDFDAAFYSCDYCCTPAAALRILQIIVGFVIVGCVSSVYGPGPFFNLLGGHTYVLVITCFCVCVTFILLLIFLFGFHSTMMRGMPCREIDFVYSVIAAILFLIAGCVEIWYGIGYWDNSGCRNVAVQNVSYRGCPVYVEWIVAAAFCFINVLLYALGALLSRLGKYYL